MICPHCTGMITTVEVISRYNQIGNLKPGTSIIESCDKMDDPIGRTIEIRCSNCGEDLTDIVMEE